MQNSVLVLSTLFLWAISCNAFQSGTLLSSRFTFVPRFFQQQQQSTRTGARSISSSNSLNMCICINCARVTNCAAYHFVETKHEQPHMTNNPTFTPQDGTPTIHVNIRTVRTSEEQQEIKRMWNEHQQETANALKQNPNIPEGQLHGTKVYDIAPVTTYEYDVVACKDFVEDIGCWVRNMPEEIRKSNPNFVPT